MVAHSRTALRADRLRALNVPVPVVVETDEKGLPLEIVETAQGRAGAGRSGQRRAEAGRSGQRRAVAVLDEWRVDDEWWRKPVSRRYLDVVLEGGAHAVLFEDLNTGDWFIQQP
jgi:hypothetical protein